MTVEEQHVETTGPTGDHQTTHTTVVESHDPDRGGGGAGWLIAIILIIALIIGAYYLMAANRNDTVRTDAITKAANDVGGAAQSAGDAVKNVTQ